MRAAMFEILCSLEGMDADHVWPTFSMDMSPRTDGPWLIMRWGAEQHRFRSLGGPRSMTLWAYQARQTGTDYKPLDNLLKSAVETLTSTVHYASLEGSSVITQVLFDGFSEDLQDAGYDAIARSASFIVLGRDA